MTALKRAAPGRPRLEDIYRDEFAFVWRTCRYLGVGEADAEDVVHEVFIVAQRRLDDYDPRYSARCWLAGITRRIVMHHHRARARAERKNAAVSPPDEATSGPDELVSRREAAAFLQDFLGRLDPDKREAFILCELEGLSAPEIARAVECKVNTVYSRIRLARRAFEKRVSRFHTSRRSHHG